MTKGVGEKDNIVPHAFSSLAFSPLGYRVDKIMGGPVLPQRTGYGTPSKKTTPKKGLALQGDPATGLLFRIGLIHKMTPLLLRRDNAHIINDPTLLGQKMTRFSSLIEKTLSLYAKLPKKCSSK